MPDAIQEWKERINACEMPILQATADYFHGRKSLAGTSITSLWKALKYDPGLCLNFLRAAGHSRRTRVKTVSHAMLLLGLPNVLNRPEGLPRIESIQQPQVRQLILKYFSKGYHASRYAKQWWKLKKEKNLEEIQAASLNSYFMEYLLCLCQPELMLKLEQQIHQGKLREASEKALFGFTIKELAYEIASDWHLPELMIDTLDDNSSKSDKLNFVILSKRLVNETETGWYHSGTEVVLEAASDCLRKPLDSVATQIHKTAVKIARCSYDVYPNVTPAAAYLNQWPQPKVKKAALTKTKKAEKKSPSRKEILKRCLYQISHNPDLNNQKIIQYAFKGFTEGLGLNRVFFALLTEDKKNLQVKFAIDKKGGQDLKHIRLPLSNKSLFARMMKKPQALWMNDENREKYWLLLPKAYIERINSDVFFTMSIFIHGKPVGLIYADMEKGNLLSEIQFNYFKQLGKLTSRALEKISNQNQVDYSDKKAVNA